MFSTDSALVVVIVCNAPVPDKLVPSVTSRQISTAISTETPILCQIPVQYDNKTIVYCDKIYYIFKCVCEE